MMITMNKIAIPSLLLATIMIAGAFAFMPVQEASTVHAGATTTLAADAITAAKIATDSIGATEIAAGAIAADAFATGAIAAGAIATDAIGALELADAIAPQVVPLAACATLFDTDISGGAAVTATMDKDFTLYVLAKGANATTLTLAGLTGGSYVHTFTTGDLAQSFVIHSAAGEVITLTGSAATVDVNMTLMSQSGAAGDCLT